MRIAYLDCASGISGDMTLGALVDAGAELAAVQQGVDSLGLPSCRLTVAETTKQGFRALQLAVEHEPEHAHRHLHHIEAMIASSTLNPRQQELARRIFGKLAEAEAKVHGTTIDKVHFHEVGAVDSIADIVGTAIALDLLGVERIVCSPVPTGSGFVEIAHGRCSIPAPATGELLRGVPLASFDCEGELTTPTGAAIVAALVNEFGPLSAMRVERIGYGAGQKDFAHPNLLRILVGETTGEAPLQRAGGATTDSIILLETNLDDAAGETIGYAIDRLWQAGALDVSTTAIAMKKNRPGVLLSVQCQSADADKLGEILFRETTTLGVRRSTLQRMILPRRSATVSTPYGDIPGTIATLPNGSERFSPEYEACAKLAAELNLPLESIQSIVRQAFKP